MTEEDTDTGGRLPLLRTLSDTPALRITATPNPALEYEKTWAEAAINGVIALTGGQTMVIASDAGSPEDYTEITVSGTSGDTVHIVSETNHTIENVRIRVRERGLTLKITNLKIKAPLALADGQPNNVQDSPPRFYDYAAIDFRGDNKWHASTPQRWIYGPTIPGTLEFEGANEVEGNGRGTPGIQGGQLTIKSTQPSARLTARGAEWLDSTNLAGHGMRVHFRETDSEIISSSYRIKPNMLVIEAGAHVTAIGRQATSAINPGGAYGVWSYGPVQINGTLIATHGEENPADIQYPSGGMVLYTSAEGLSNPENYTAAQLTSSVGPEGELIGITSDFSVSNGRSGINYQIGSTGTAWSIAPMVVEGRIEGEGGRNIGGSGGGAGGGADGWGVYIAYLETKGIPVIEGTGWAGVSASISSTAISDGASKDFAAKITGVGKGRDTDSGIGGRGITISSLGTSYGEPSNGTYVMTKDTVLNGVVTGNLLPSNGAAGVELGFSTYNLDFRGKIEPDAALLAQSASHEARVSASGNVTIAEGAQVTGLARSTNAISSISDAGSTRAGFRADGSLTVNGMLTARGAKGMQATQNNPSYTNTFNAPGVHVAGDLIIGANAEITADGGNSGPTQGVPILIANGYDNTNSAEIVRTVTVNGSPTIKNSLGDSLYPIYMDQKPNNDTIVNNQRASYYYLANELRAYNNFAPYNDRMMHMFVPAGHYNAARSGRFGSGSNDGAAVNPSAKTFEVKAQYSPVNKYEFKLATANTPSTVDTADIAPSATGITLKDENDATLDNDRHLNLAVGQTKRIIPVLTGPTDYDRIVSGGFSTYNLAANVFSYDQGYITGLNGGSVTSMTATVNPYRPRPDVSAVSASTTINVSGGEGPGTPVITISTQPQNVSVSPGQTASLSVTASVTPSGTLTYQWYKNTSASNSGGTALSGATQASYSIPTDLAPGPHYYYVVVSSTGATPVPSSVATVTVAAVRVTGVSLNKSTLELNVGMSERLIATVLPADATNKTVTWSSSNTDVATVAANGSVSARGVGTATITVTTEDGPHTATCSVTVLPPLPTGLRLTSPAYMLVQPGGSVEATVATTPAGAVSDGITWALISPGGSSTPLAATFDNAVISGSITGNTTVAATVKTGATAGTYTLRASIVRAGSSTLSASAVFEVAAFADAEDDLRLLENSITVNPARRDGAALPFAINDVTAASLAIIQPGATVRLYQNYKDLADRGTPLTTVSASLLDMQTIEVKAPQGAANTSLKNVTAVIVNPNGDDVSLTGKLSISIRSQRPKLTFSTAAPLNAFYSVDGKMMSAAVTATADDGSTVRVTGLTPSGSNTARHPAYTGDTGSGSLRLVSGQRTGSYKYTATVEVEGYHPYAATEKAPVASFRVTNDAPKIAVSPKTLTLDTADTATGGRLRLSSSVAGRTLSAGWGPVVGAELSRTGKSTVALATSTSPSGTDILVTVPGDTEAGKYQLRLYFDNDGAQGSATVNLTVKKGSFAGGSKRPGLSANPKSITVNVNHGGDIARVDLVPTAGNIVVDKDEWVNVKNTLEESGIGFEANNDNSVTLSVAGDLTKSQTHAFNTSGTLADAMFKKNAGIKINISNKASAFKLSQKGKIDVTNEDSQTAVTVKLSNTTSLIEKVYLYDPMTAAELNEFAGKFDPANPEAAATPRSTQFEVVEMEDGTGFTDNLFHVRAIGGVPPNGRARQNLAVFIVLKNGEGISSWTQKSNGTYSNKALAITPAQASAKARASKTTLNLYAGRPTMSDSLAISLTAPAFAELGAVSISSKSSNDKLKLTNGFELRQAGTDEFGRGLWEIGFENGRAPEASPGSKLKGSYSLTLEVWPEGTFTWKDSDIIPNGEGKTAARPATVKVRVNVR